MVPLQGIQYPCKEDAVFFWHWNRPSPAANTEKKAISLPCDLAFFLCVAGGNLPLIASRGEGLSQFQRQHKCLGPLYLFWLLLVSIATMLLLLFPFLSSLNSSLYFFNSFSMSLNHCYFYFMFTQILLQLTIVHSSIAATFYPCSHNYCYSFPVLTQLLLLPRLMCTLQ
jgi:hypothetical protein